MALGQITRLADGFINFLAGLGTWKDKSSHHQPTFSYLDPAQLEAFYRGNWIARKIVEIPAFDATRAWRRWQGTDEQIEQLEECERALNLQLRLFSAMQKSRLYGGAALVIGVKDGKDWNEELDVDKIKKGDLKFVHTVSRWSLTAGPRVRDVTSPWFGEPSYYERAVGVDAPPIGGVQAPAVLVPGNLGLLAIHPSRVVQLIGLDYPEPERGMDSWGDSVLQPVNSAIRDAGLVNSSVSAAISELKLDVIKVSGLAEMFSTPESTAKAVTRFGNANMAKSVVNAILIDKENEDWDRKEIGFANIDTIMQTFLMICAGAADVPATRLLGREPAGMSSTGESDTRNYYDRISSDQKMRLTPALSRLDEVIIRSTFGTRDPSIHYEWNSLWQTTESEKADVELKKAQAHAVDVQSGLIEEEVLKQARESSLIDSGFLYPGIEAAIEAYEEAVANGDIVDENDLDANGGDDANGDDADGEDGDAVVANGNGNVPPQLNGKGNGKAANGKIKAADKHARPHT